MLGVLAASSTLSRGSPADAAETTPPPTPQSVFFVGKSENRNQVHYGIRLGPGCKPSGGRPVYAYWKMNEHGGALESLLAIEERAYGIAAEQQIALTPDGTRVRVNLNAVPGRAIDVVVSHRDGVCRASARTDIAGAPARLDNIYVRLRWPLGVDYILLTGTRSSD